MGGSIECPRCGEACVPVGLSVFNALDCPRSGVRAEMQAAVCIECQHAGVFKRVVAWFLEGDSVMTSWADACTKRPAATLDPEILAPAAMVARNTIVANELAFCLSHERPERVAEICRAVGRALGGNVPQETA